MAKKKSKAKNKNNANNRLPVGTENPPDSESKNLIDEPAPDEVAGAAQDALPVCIDPSIYLSEC